MSSALPGCSKRQILICQSPWDVPCSLLGNRFLGEKHNSSITFHAQQLSLNTMQQPLHGFLPIEPIKNAQALAPSFSSISFLPFLFGTSHEQCPTWMFEKADAGMPKSLGCNLLGGLWTCFLDFCESSGLNTPKPQPHLSHPFLFLLFSLEPHMSSALPGCSKRQTNLSAWILSALESTWLNEMKYRHGPSETLGWTK